MVPQAGETGCWHAAGMVETKTRWGALSDWPPSAVQEIYLLRHGQTLANADGIIQGWVDYPLTELGLQQARDTAEALSTLECRHIFTSPIGRAARTAVILAEAMPDAVVAVLPGMTEIHAGAVTGRTWDEFAQIYPESYRDFRQRLVSGPGAIAKEGLPGWEPFEHVVYRTWHAIGAVLACVTAPIVMVVSHGDTINCLLTQALHGSALTGDWPYRQPNCAVSRLVLTPQGPRLPDGVRVLHHREVT